MAALLTVTLFGLWHNGHTVEAPPRRRLDDFHDPAGLRSSALHGRCGRPHGAPRREEAPGRALTYRDNTTARLVLEGLASEAEML